MSLLGGEAEAGRASNQRARVNLECCGYPAHWVGTVPSAVIKASGNRRKTPDLSSTGRLMFRFTGCQSRWKQR